MFWLCGTQLRLWGEETPNLTGIKFSKRAHIDDLITRTNFGADQLRGIGVAKSEIAVFSLTTLTLACECVIHVYKLKRTFTLTRQVRDFYVVQC